MLLEPRTRILNTDPDPGQPNEQRILNAEKIYYGIDCVSKVPERPPPGPRTWGSRR